MTSLQGELVEIRDYVSKIDRWAKRINAREVMTDRRVNGETFNEKNPSKDALRRRAGLIAGQPARHNSAGE